MLYYFKKLRLSYGFRFYKRKYKNDFKFKISSLTLSNENEYEDIWMKKFRLTQETKELNKQYFNRELGSIWEQINKEIFKSTSHLYRDNNSN